MRQKSKKREKKEPGVTVYKIKLSHVYLYSALYNTDCVKAALQSQTGK